jgi:hypothetical protein
MNKCVKVWVVVAILVVVGSGFEGVSATWFIHPSIECKLIGPEGDTLPGFSNADYTFVFWLINNKELTSEDGKNPKVTLTISGGKITSTYSDYFDNIIHSETTATFSSSGEFKAGTAKIGIVRIVPTVPTGSSLSIEINGEVEDIDIVDNYISRAQDSISYNIVELQPDSLDIYTYLSDLASSRSKITENYINMYQNFMDPSIGVPFQGLNPYDVSRDYIEGAKNTVKVVEYSDTLLMAITDPAAGLFLGSSSLISEIFGIPSPLMYIFDTQWYYMTFGYIDHNVTLN